jgi:DNA polymerase/3'-5' exonuclease PolX
MSDILIDAEPHNRNSDLANVLATLATYYILSNDKYRANAFTKASNAVANYPYPLVSGSQARVLPGVGASSADIIDEYLLTGKVQRLLDLDKAFTEQKNTIEAFRKIYGVGPVAAQKFYNNGYRYVEQIAATAALNDKQQKGIKWYYHINLRIDRGEMDIIYNKFREILNGYYWDIVGSYRRNEPNSGDVDLLVQKNNINTNINNILALLRPYLVDDLAQGDTKYMGIMRLSNQYNAHRIDILLVPAENWAYTLLFFTGSEHFNILCRRRAIELGLILNEYGLYNNVTNQSYPANTEQDIFTLLGIKYLSPVERTKDCVLTFI